MFGNRTGFHAGLTLLVWTAFLSSSFAIETDFQPTVELLTPAGHYYDATVPDTLDLAERGRLAVHGLTSFLNDKKHYEPYGHGFFNTDLPYLSSRFTQSPEGGGAPNWGKTYDAMVLARAMSGSRENLDIEAKTLAGMIKHIRSGHSVPAARVTMALMSLYQESPDPKLRGLIRKMADGLCDVLKVKGDYAYYYDFQEQPADMRECKTGIVGYGGEQVYTHGSILRALSRWYEWNGDDRYRIVTEQLKNFLLQKETWQPEAAPKAVVPDEHGQFMGHIHGYCAALMGLLRYAEATHDVRVMQFVREGYEYLRNFGIARIGLFGEMCGAGDMTYLAVKLSRLGVGDYWEDVDQYTRNQLAEGQVTDLEKLKRAAAAAPVLARIDPKHDTGVQQPLNPGQEQVPIDPIEETADHVCERFLGAYLTDNSWPTCVPRQRFMMVICCTGNSVMGLYAAWDGIVECHDGSVQVNLLLNRASQWLDIDSYLPYVGKVVIRNKSARQIAVRIPRWVDAKAVASQVNGEAAAPFWVDRRLVFANVAPKDEITLTFPMVESKETYTLKWKKSGYWQESNNPGNHWQADDPAAQFTFTLRGNTVVDVTPREEGEAYRRYERDGMKTDKTPMHQVRRFVGAKQIAW